MLLRGTTPSVCRHRLKYLVSSRVQYSTQLPLAVGYQPQQVESQRQQKRQIDSSLKQRCSRGTFNMILPPPNVTGNLHLGHALMATVQDVICRYQRQMGYEVVWVPGTDHAGIATQVMVEKKLMKEQSLSRHQVGRADFLKEVWKWKQEKEGGIIDDLQKLGCTLNWDREYFTMDEQRVHAVMTAFIQLFEEGLINRRESLVNWSCALESAISDIEVETLELKGPTEICVPGYDKNIRFGRIYDISYRICNSDDEIVVSTTRPETLLGDVAVAVHPKDDRYMKYRNLPEVRLRHPFRNDTIPLIFDNTVDTSFGTGAVKITPAHDKNDLDVAQRHLLEPIQVFTEQGKILKQFDGFAEMRRFEAREHVLEALAQQQLLRAVRDHSMILPVCSRSKDVIEYMLRPQWFLHCQQLAEAAAAEVRSGRLQIVPPNFECEWYRWLENCHDWCISRQLWWGHRIPAYYAETADGKSCWVAALNRDEAFKKAVLQLGNENLRIEQDVDVLDTWFSSSLLPFSTFGWPALEYAKHYPLDLMETGHDILFFWVARMAMLGLKLTGQVPFKKVLLNGIICDAHGRKMSKSLGNVITPQQVVQGASLKSLQEELEKSFTTGVLTTEELKKSLQGLQKMFPNGIQECGTDALRFTLCSHNIKNHFINFDVAECHTNKLFLNKIWQATRFTLAAANRLEMPLEEIESLNKAPLGRWDRWILSRLTNTLQTCRQSFELYNLHTATAALKTFFYTNVCDVYLETTKANINAMNSEGYVHCATLATCLSWALQAMSPFTPFIADELLQHLPKQVQLNLSAFYDEQLESEITEILDICQCIRQLKSRNQISKKHDPRVQLFAQTPQTLAVLKPYIDQIKLLTLTNGVELGLKNSLPERFRHSFNSTAGHLCSFSLSVNDFYQQSPSRTGVSMSQLNEKKLQKLLNALDHNRLRVESEGFRKSASEDVQRKHMEKIKQLEIEIENIKRLASS